MWSVNICGGLLDPDAPACCWVTLGIDLDQPSQFLEGGYFHGPTPGSIRLSTTRYGSFIIGLWLKSGSSATLTSRSSLWALRSNPISVVAKVCVKCAMAVSHPTLLVISQICSAAWLQLGGVVVSYNLVESSTVGSVLLLTANSHSFFAWLRIDLTFWRRQS